MYIWGTWLLCVFYTRVLDVYLYNWLLTELRLNFSSSKLACKHEWDFCIGFSISWLIPWGLQLPIKACLLNHSPQEFGKDLCLFVCIIKSALASPSTTFFFSVPQKEHHAPRSLDCTAEHFCMGYDAAPVSQLPQKAPGRSWVLRSTVIWGSYLRMTVVLVPFLLLS